MIFELLATAWILVVKQNYSYVPSVASYVSPHDYEPQRIRYTCYLDTGHKTASGVDTRYGIIAASSEHMGDVAILYDEDKNFIGYFEALDTGGNPIEQGYVIDVFCESEEQMYELVNTYGYYLYIQWIDAEG